MRFGKVAESICLGILRCEMHGYKDMSFYLCYKLSGTPHVFFSQTGGQRETSPHPLRAYRRKDHPAHAGNSSQLPSTPPRYSRPSNASYSNHRHEKSFFHLPEAKTILPHPWNRKHARSMFHPYIPLLFSARRHLLSAPCDDAKCLSRKYR